MCFFVAALVVFVKNGYCLNVVVTVLDLVYLNDNLSFHFIACNSRMSDVPSSYTCESICIVVVIKR
jgi:hypothetical protein